MYASIFVSYGTTCTLLEHCCLQKLVGVHWLSSHDTGDTCMVSGTRFMLELW